jgi:hypothetical protein
VSAKQDRTLAYGSISFCSSALHLIRRTTLLELGGCCNGLYGCVRLEWPCLGLDWLCSPPQGRRART